MHVTLCAREAILFVQPRTDGEDGSFRAICYFSYFCGSFFVAFIEYFISICGTIISAYSNSISFVILLYVSALLGTYRYIFFWLCFEWARETHVYIKYSLNEFEALSKPHKKLTTLLKLY